MNKENKNMLQFEEKFKQKFNEKYTDKILEISQEEAFKQRIIKIDGKKMKVNWSVEMQEDLLRFHGLDFEDELIIIILSEIESELNGAYKEKEVVNTVVYDSGGKPYLDLKIVEKVN